MNDQRVAHERLSAHLDVVPQDLAVPLGAAFSETLASFASASHSFWAEAISLNKLVVQEDIGILLSFMLVLLMGIINYKCQLSILAQRT